MVNLQKYIRELIHLHDCVIIPGLGAFISIYKPADIKDNKLSPPSKNFDFKEKINHDDDLLINHISVKENIKTSNVKQQVDEFVIKTKTDLAQGKKVGIEGLGHFILDTERNILFKQISPKDSYSDFYGLPEIEAKKQNKVSEPVEFKIDIEDFPKRKLTPLYIIVPILLVIAIAIYFGSDFFSGDTTINATQLNEPEGKDPRVDKALNSLTSKKDALFYEEKNKEAVPEGQKQGNINYYLIAGSFKTHDNALILKTQLEKEGFNPEIINTDGVHYRISVGSYTDKNLALESLEKILNETNRKTVWLLSQPVN